MFLYIVYTIILLYLAVVVALEFFSEKRWKNQIAIVMVLLIFTMRLLQVK